MKQLILIEGNENLLNQNELLIEDSDDFECILKRRDEQGNIKTYAVIPVEDYIEELEEAYKGEKEE